MATAVILPRQGQSVESCIITKWHKKPGDKVAIGDVLFSYETDKSAFDEEAKVEGTFLGTFFEEGDDVPCLLNVCVIGEPGEDISKFAPDGASTPVAEPVKEAAATAASPAATVAATITAAMPTSDAGRVFASPRAKAAAERMGVDYTAASASGPNGRILERDVLAIEKTAHVAVAQAAPVATAPVCAPTETAYTDVKLSGVRKAIAKAMHDSLSNSAQLTHHLTFDATDILEFRKRLKADGEKLGMPNITLNDIILYAVSRTLKTHKELNAHYLGDTMRFFSNVNLGIAVDTDRGLLVPTLMNADKMSLSEISAKTKALAAAAQSGTISPDLLKGGTFTISNLGSLGIEMFTPVINPPQTGILGVNTIITRVRDVNGKIETYPAMGLSLTYDHRALDGAPASRFLSDLKNNLESFTLLLAK